MTGRANSRVFRRLAMSPQEAAQVLREFSRSTGSFSLTKEQVLEKYNDKWIAIYGGKVAAVADSLDELTSFVAAQGLPASETLFRHISPKEKVFIL